MTLLFLLAYLLGVSTVTFLHEVCCLLEVNASAMRCCSGWCLNFCIDAYSITGVLTVLTSSCPRTTHIRRQLLPRTSSHTWFFLS
jgi:hypothetical protein